MSLWRRSLDFYLMGAWDTQFFIEVNGQSRVYFPSASDNTLWKVRTM